MSELGLNEQHSKVIKQYLEFALQQRACHLRAIDCLFQDVVDARLLESSYTVDEVMEMLAGLRAVVNGEARDGLAGAAHAQVLLLQQLCTQAERWHLHLEVNFSELENRSLLEQVRHLEENKNLDSVNSSKLNKEDQTTSRPDDDGPAALLHREIKRLSTIAAEQRDAMNDLEEQVAVQQTARHVAEKALRNAEKEIMTIKEQMRQLETELSSRASVMEESPSCAEIQFEITSTTTSHDKSEERRLRDELKQTYARLTLAEQELQCKVNESSAFSNLRRMLDSKNEQLRSLRAQLAKFQQNAPTTIGDADDDED